MSSLHAAIINDRLHQVRMLLGVGVRVDVKDEQGRTPLMVACFMTNKKRRQVVCDLLLGSGANVDLMDKFKRTLLMYACATRNIFLLKELTEYVEIDLNKKDKDGNTCLMYAAIEGDVEVVKLILEPFEMYGISLDKRNKCGFTAYLLALKNGNVECAQILKDKGASTNMFDLENYWGGKEWLASHYKNRLDRESKQSAHHVRAKSENMQRREDSHNHGILQRPRSMPPLFHYPECHKTNNSQENYQNKQGVRKSEPRSMASSLGRSVDDRSRESKSQGAAKGLKLPRPVTGSSVSKTAPRAKKAWNDENEAGTAPDYQKVEDGDYDAITRTQTGCSFRSDAMTTAGKSDFRRCVSTSTGEKHPRKRQQEQLIKLFEQYSMNHLHLPSARPRGHGQASGSQAKLGSKKDDDIKQQLLRAFEQKAETAFSLPQRKRRQSKPRLKMSDIKAKLRAIAMLASIRAAAGD
eukprot:Seg381.32 transcript_id=Seg381.32/GoldUCD/mRNA.D3Y31 product="Ankyrin repeat domain-containing protein 63" protein_id=Seg381.32/GoldUCD/D3Y31